MKPPPGPMFSFGTDTRPRPARSSRSVRAVSAPVGRPRGDRRARTVGCAVGLAVALGLAGAAVLAPYSGTAGSSSGLPADTLPTASGPAPFAP